MSPLPFLLMFLGQEPRIPVDRAARCALLLEICEAPTAGVYIGGPKVNRTRDIVGLLLEAADNELATIRKGVGLYEKRGEKDGAEWMWRRDVLDIFAKVIWDIPSKAPGWAPGGPMAPLAVQHGRLVITRLFPASRTGVWFTFGQYDHLYGKGKRRNLAPFRAQRIPAVKLESMIRDAMRDVPVKNGVWQLEG